MRRSPPSKVAAIALLASALAPALASAADPSALEDEAREVVPQAYRAAKRPVPAADKALTRAARALAVRVLKDGAAAATNPENVVVELSKAGVWDPSPRIIAVKVSPAEYVAQSLEKRSDLAAEPADHFAVGVAVRDDEAAAVLLLSERRAELEPFAVEVAVGAAEHLAGRLAFPLHDARIYVTTPAGTARAQPPMRATRDRFDADLSFPKAGSYTVEVVAESVKGPEVVALLRVEAGGKLEARAGPAVKPEKDDLGKAEAQVLAAINARRARHGLPALARSSLLDSVAAAHAQEMVKLNYFGHVSPLHGDVAERLKDQGFQYQRATENLGEAASALEAHLAIEESPGHLANVLDPKVDLVGLGTARVRRGKIDNVIVVEVYARERTGAAAATTTGNAAGDVRAALNGERQKRGLPALAADPNLDRVALEHAREMVASLLPAPAVKGRSITEKALDLGDFASAAADIFVSDTVAVVTNSRNVASRLYDAVGVAAVRGPNPKGKGEKLWMVVVYAKRDAE